ncbi:hypothetical protein [Plasmodium yoelii yoelii]|uniref:Uncharacterized protein n=1 Tax=Plasmodium yoelii yoelii TaxID=73239 RepID=Q7RPL4_PLAYO|nr:hypothetical protein [Plasmodium yoelii yoelii]
MCVLIMLYIKNITYIIKISDISLCVNNKTLATELAPKTYTKHKSKKYTPFNSKKYYPV